jgi:hypothetical protein
VQALCLLNGTWATEPSFRPLSGVVKLMGPVDLCLRGTRLDPWADCAVTRNLTEMSVGLPHYGRKLPPPKGEAFETGQPREILVVNCECDS